MMNIIIRLFDVIFSCLGIFLLLPIFIVVFLIGYFDTGSPFFVQKRLGKNKQIFNLIKFRTMSLDTEDVATHLVCRSSVTKFGAFLRKTKLDELPQLWNVLTGDMSLVGPRPCLPSQSKLIACRDELRVFSIRPGITGVAQVLRVDMSAPELLAKHDSQYVEKMSLRLYFRCIILTAVGHGSGDQIR